MEVRTSQCRTCKAEIVWAVTPKGKNMPVDSTPVPDGGWMLREGDDDKPHAVAADGSDMARYQSHFKSCPNASQHSKAQPSSPQRGAPGAVDKAKECVELRERLDKCRAAYVELRKENVELKTRLAG